MTMISRIYLSIIIFIVGIIWLVLLIVDGVTVNLSWLHPLPSVVSILMLLGGAFDIWLWRLPILPKGFVKRPNIRGTWRVIIKSDWQDPSTGKIIDPIEGYIAVHQTFSSLSIHLMTNESSSDLVGGSIYFIDNEFRITAVYRNEPDILIRNRSHIHYGALKLNVIGRPVNALDGHYWTDQGTMGNIKTTGHQRKIIHDFEAAKTTFDNQEHTSSVTGRLG
jgi:hypothetical protein